MTTYKGAQIIITSMAGCYGFRWHLGEQRGEGQPEYPQTRLAEQAARQQIDAALEQKQAQRGE